MYRAMEENTDSVERFGVCKQHFISTGVGHRLPHITVSSLNYNNN